MSQRQLKVKDFGMKASMSFSKYHTQHWSGFIDIPGHKFDGKKITKDVKVHKPFGSGQVETFILIEGIDKEFKSVKEVLDHFETIT